MSRAAYMLTGLRSRRGFGVPCSQMPRSLSPRWDDGAAHVQKFNPLGGNRLLQRLGPADASRLQPHLKKFSMDLGAVLHNQGAAIEHVYFPLGGMISLLAVMKMGEQIETAIVGSSAMPLALAIAGYDRDRFGSAHARVPLTQGALSGSDVP
jgi:hypothetical protein